MTGVAGGDMPTIELTAADVGDTADDFTTPVVVRALAAFSVGGRCAFVELLALSELVFEPPLSATERRVLLPPSPLGGRVFTELSVSCDECLLEAGCEVGDSCNGDSGGDCAFVAGTHLSASFMGEEAAEDDAVDFVGDGVPVWPVCEAGPPSVCDGVWVILFSDRSASRDKPSTHAGFDDVLRCLDPIVSSLRLRLPDHRSTGST